jgi:hypothetical protein
MPISEKQKRQALLFVILCAGLLLFVYFRYFNGGNRDAKAFQTMTSPTSSISLTFPGAWTEIDFGPNATIEMMHTAKERAMSVVEESSADYASGFTIHDYTELLKSVFESTAGEPVISTTTNVIIGEISAEQFEVSCVIEKNKLVYLITCFERDGTFYRIGAWTTPSKYDEAKPVFDSILETVTFHS